MSSIQQYIDLYESCSSAVDAGSTAVMNLPRRDALERLRGAKLPSRGDENYEISDLEDVFAPDYGLNINRISAANVDIDEPFRCDVPNMSTSLFYFFNDTYYDDNIVRPALSAGVIVKSLREAGETHREILEKYYAKIAPMDDAQVALNTLLAQDGLFVYVPAGVVVERPIQVVNLLRAESPLMVNRRMLIIIEAGAQVRLLVCDHTQSPGVKFLNSQVLEVYVGENSVFDYYDLEESSIDTSRVSSMWLRQAAGSNVLVNGMTLTNGFTRNNYRIDINGEHAETRLLGMAIADGRQHVDNHTHISHNAGYCHSDELFKYVLEDEARGSFTGKILVAQGAQKTQAYQSNRNICAESARMHTKPQLEIYTDDVKCSHGATVGQLDPDALFYMQARGISCQEARTLLMQAFMSDIIDGIRLEALKDRLRHLVEKRFAGTLAQCRNCLGTSCHGKMKSIEKRKN